MVLRRLLSDGRGAPMSRSELRAPPVANSAKRAASRGSESVHANQNQLLRRRNQTGCRKIPCRASRPIKLFTRLPRRAGAVQSGRLESADADEATVGIASLPYATFGRNVSLARGRMYGQRCTSDGSRS